MMTSIKFQMAVGFGLFALVLAACQKPSVTSEGDAENRIDATHAFQDLQTGFKSKGRERYVKVDVSAFRKAIAEGADTEIEVVLFENRPVVLVVEQSTEISASNGILQGHVKDHPDATFTFVVNQGSLVGSLRSKSGDAVIEILPFQSSSHVIRQKKLESLGCLEEETANEVSDQEDGELHVMANPVIDILAAYTPAAKAKHGKAGVEALIQMGIADTNKTLADSGALVSVRLVGMIETKQSETSDFSADLTALKGTRDGRWDELHMARDRYGADQVTVVAAYNNNDTLAGIGSKIQNAASAFTIVRTSAFDQFTFTHELGHNMGLGHGNGIESVKGGFRTIMAYGDMPRIRRFSNPARPYGNFATGDKNHNSVAIINRNAARISSYRTRVGKSDSFYLTP